MHAQAPDDDWQLGRSAGDSTRRSGHEAAMNRDVWSTLTVARTSFPCCAGTFVLLRAVPAGRAERSGIRFDCACESP